MVKSPKCHYYNITACGCNGKTKPHDQFQKNLYQDIEAPSRNQILNLSNGLLFNEVMMLAGGGASGS